MEAAHQSERMIAFGRRREATRQGAGERVVFGIMLGGIATLLGMFGYHELTGLHHLNVFERSFARRHLAATSELITGQIDLSLAAMQDDQPLATSELLSTEVARQLYQHHVEFAAALLRQGNVERFNQLRAETSFYLLELGHHDLHDLDLTGVNLKGVSLVGSNLAGCTLTRANLSYADLTNADLTGAEVSQASFHEATMPGSSLINLSGRAVDFSRAVLVGSKLMNIARLTQSDFSQAVLSRANLWGSRFPGAVFDGADMTMVSAVETDFSSVDHMAAVDLTGANLSSAKLAARHTPRAWLVNAEGISPEDLKGLRRQGAVVAANDVLGLVDERIVKGFSAQLEAGEECTPQQRRGCLLTMLKQYYLQATSE